MDCLLNAINQIIRAEQSQITVRHLFYRLVGQHVIPKTEHAYKGLVGHLSRWRRSGQIPWESFADTTRWHIRQPTFDSVADALQNAAESYRRDLWRDQSCYVEFWLEKDAIASIVSNVANSWGVPVFVARGFASLSSLYGAASTFRRQAAKGKRVIIYHLGDYDPSGVAAGEAIQNAFRNDFHVPISFIRAAVTREQIERLNLPTRPTKQTDTRSRKWTGGECVELDTMPPSEIQGLVESCIRQNVEPAAWNELVRTEQLERISMSEFLSAWRAQVA
jgi:hypothetical protein